jgi:hypothetical protein
MLLIWVRTLVLNSKGRTQTECVFVSTVLRRIFGSMRDKVTGDYDSLLGYGTL